MPFIYIRRSDTTITRTGVTIAMAGHSRRGFSPTGCVRYATSLSSGINGQIRWSRCPRWMRANASAWRSTAFGVSRHAQHEVRNQPMLIGR